MKVKDVFNALTWPQKLANIALVLATVSGLAWYAVYRHDNKVIVNYEAVEAVKTNNKVKQHEELIKQKFKAPVSPVIANSVDSLLKRHSDTVELPSIGEYSLNAKDQRGASANVGAQDGLHFVGTGKDQGSTEPLRNCHIEKVSDVYGLPVYMWVGDELMQKEVEVCD